LAVLRPDDAGPEAADALDRLVGVCWHTDPMLGGRGWQFRYEPNVIKQIEERMADIEPGEARHRVLAEVQEYFAGPGFKITAWPANARQVPESADLQVVLCEDESLARTICALADDSDPQAPIPRRFQNAILAVAARPGALNVATERAKRLLAAEAIGREHRTDDQILKRPEAQAALRVVQRRGGKAAIVYRRRLASDAQEDLAERLDRVAAVSPLAYTAGARLLREAVRAAEGPKTQLRSGPFHALDADWGARVACYALVASGLKNAGGLGRAAENLRLSDGAEAAWWFGLLDDGRALRAVRALRILVEAVA